MDPGGSGSLLALNQSELKCGFSFRQLCYVLTLLRSRHGANLLKYA